MALAQQAHDGIANRSSVMAVEAAAKTGFPGIWIHGKSIRVDFMHKGVRHRHTLGLDPTKATLKHAARLRSTAMYALRTGPYNEAAMFPHTRPAERTGPPTTGISARRERMSHDVKN